MEAFRISWVDRKHASVNHTDSTLHCCINKVTRYFVQSPSPQNPAIAEIKIKARSDFKKLMQYAAQNGKVLHII
jgi:hypothetical protein